MSPDPHRRQRILWFATMNVIAVVIAASIFFFVLRGDILDVMFRSAMLGIFEYKLVVVLVAMSPLFASLLVGMAYAQRALRRKRLQAAGATPPAPEPTV